MKKVVDFEFIGVKDCGETSCPHCGAAGRYIYTWREDSNYFSAMAGCYKLMTGQLEKNDEAKYMELLAKKVAKGEKLNGWDKRVLGLKKAVVDGKANAEWARMKVLDVLMERKSYLGQRRF